MTKPIQGIVFVHGINQDKGDLSRMQSWFEERLTKFDLIDRFKNQDNNSLNVWCAKWRSLGDFKRDLIDLGINQIQRERAESDIQAVIVEAWSALSKQGPAEAKRGLLVVAHSMGQPLSVMALHSLQKADLSPAGFSYPIPTSLLSVGGPLGNDDPLFKFYLAHEFDNKPWVAKLVPKKPEALHEWFDVWNPLDPICHDPIVGSSTYPGSQHIMFKVPSQPPIPLPFTNPIADYHSAYFDYRDVYEYAKQLLDTLVHQS